MNYTIQKQHFHKAKIMSMFWSLNRNLKNNRDDLVATFKWHEYLYHINIGGTKSIKSKKFKEIQCSKNFMYSSMIFLETESEDNLNVKKIEEDFEKICENLLKKELNEPGFILNYITNNDEYNKIIKYLTLQYVRNPNRYISYQHSYFDHLIKNSPNPYLFDLFDLRNFENFLLFANNNIIKEYHHILSYFNNYSFKIFINSQNDNILTDNTIINLNQNDYCKILLKDEYENYKDLFQDTYIMTINSQYFIIFYPENIANEIHFVNQFYLKHKYNIDLFYCRNIVYMQENEDFFFIK